MTTDAHHGHPSTTLGDFGGPTGTTGSAGPIGHGSLPLAGRTVLVTGVSRRIGIGHVIVCHAANYGVGIVAHHHRPHDAFRPWGVNDIDVVIASIRTYPIGPARLINIPTDPATTGEPARVVRQATATAGYLDAPVCNQAVSSPNGSLSEMTEAALDARWTVGARASILLARAFAAQEGFVSSVPTGSARRRGSIVFLTPGQDLDPLSGEIACATAKAAIAGLTLTISDELIDVDITVGTTSPGPIDIGYVTEEDRKTTAVTFPQGRRGEPDDAARLIAWLPTDRARQITGQVVNSEDGFARWRR